MAKWSMDRLERECRKALVERTKLTTANLRDHAADVEPMRGGRISVRVDNHLSAMLDGVVHELLHQVLEPDLDGVFDAECEETIVLALEDAMVRRVNRSVGRSRWWRRAVNGKLPR